MKNIMHLEDLAFFEEPSTIVKIVSALIFTILHKTQALGDLTIKYDGAPLVAFGNEEGFFVSDKGYFNKTPTRYYSIEEIEKSKMNETKKDKLAAVFHTFSGMYIREGMVYLADFLFANCFPHVPTTVNSFKPNIIRYSLKRGDLSNFRIGLAHHTRLFCGEHIKRGFLDQRVVWEPRLVPDCSHEALDEDYVFAQLSGLKYELFLESKERVKELRSRLNTLARECTCYAPCLLNDYRKEGYKTLANNLDILIDIKYKILEYLNRGSHTKLFDMHINNEKTTHEGYVFRYEDYVVKLVDRFQFSKANFDQSTERGWDLTKN